MATESKRLEARRPVQAQFEHSDALLDEALEETFSASDPIAISFRAKRVPGRAPPSTDATGTDRAAVNAPAAGKPAEQAAIFGGEAVLIERLLPAARKTLMMVSDGAPLTDAARLLRAVSISSSAVPKPQWSASSRRPMSSARSVSVRAAAE